MGQMQALSYFVHAGFVVKLVMLILAAASLVSWTFIIQRAWYFKQKRKDASDFTQRFWESHDLSRLYRDVDHQDERRQGLVAIFHAGFKEYLRLRKQAKLSLEPISRLMQIKEDKEALEMQKHLSFLASVGSISPYVGLFGTVWGIMAALQALGHAQQATISMIAPGISEALVATALGLFTAIPAVLAYNRYSVQTQHLLDRYRLFQDELLALMVHQEDEVA